MSKLIALDDGHGMETAGKRTPYIPELGREVHENEFNRAVVGYLDQELKRCGFRTVLTAPGDVDTPLTTRTNTANNQGADLFISIHYNAIDSKFDGPGLDPEGIAVFIYPGTKDSRRLAEMVEAQLLKVTGEKQYSRGVLEEDFHVLRESHMPAILSENGFMDNKREALLMLSPEYQKKVAEAHARGICEYFGVDYVKEAPVMVAAVAMPAAVSKPETVGPGHPLDPTLANNIINSIMVPLWNSAHASGNKISENWIHFCADELRKAAGLPL